MPLQVIKKDEFRVPIKAWTNEIEDSAYSQLANLAKMPFIHKHIAVMPDVHAGIGSTVGSVIATHKAIIPAAVGVDIGCGMMAIQTELNAKDLPDNLHGIRSSIEQAVPHGRTDNGQLNDKGAWKADALPDVVRDHWIRLNDDNRFVEIVSNYPKLFDKGVNTYRHLGTLGTGNHFIEICLDTNNTVWVMLHSGSRGIGNRIGSFFIEKAQEEMRRYFINLPDKDLAYLPEGSDLFHSYLNAVSWAQDFAKQNRELMMKATLRALSDTLGKSIVYSAQAINCHHNYVERENHFGSNVWVTRKGAVRARQDDLGIIPGSMGAKSFIVRGKGNPESFNSCSHGAGRKMGRKEAKRRFTTEDLIQQTQGVECRKDADVVDEIPSAYKDIQEVMNNQSDLVEVVAELKQILCVKG